MLYLQHIWKKRGPAAHRRIELLLVALVAFSGGAVAGSLLVTRGAVPNSGRTSSSVAPAPAMTGDQRHALELYRAQERAAADVDAPTQRHAALDRYRAAEIAARSAGTADRQRAWELYRGGERAVAAETDARRRALDLYRDGEIGARTAP